jgi:hypothetical protein
MRRDAGVLARGLIIGVLAVSVAGCVTHGQRTGGLAPGQRATVAFESIDGAPPEVFQKLVQTLNDEADARQVPVVTREGYAPYRIRGYLATSVVKKQTVVSWVWDVYDGETRRAARLAGEEKAGPAGRDAWHAASNDAVLGRIARSGMDQLAVFLSVPSASPAAPTPSAGPEEDRPLTVAAADDFRPEAQGIFRLPASRVAGDTEVSGTGSTGPEAPLPPRRPGLRPQQIATANAL